MDARKWDAVQHVAPGQFTPAQRQRLEAVTAAVALLGKATPVDDLLAVADFIAGGA